MLQRAARGLASRRSAPWRGAKSSADEAAPSGPTASKSSSSGSKPRTLLEHAQSPEARADSAREWMYELRSAESHPLTTQAVLGTAPLHSAAAPSLPSAASSPSLPSSASSSSTAASASASTAAVPSTSLTESAASDELTVRPTVDPSLAFDDAGRREVVAQLRSSHAAIIVAGQAVDETSARWHVVSFLLGAALAGWWGFTAGHESGREEERMAISHKLDRFRAAVRYHGREEQLTRVLMLMVVGCWAMAAS